MLSYERYVDWFDEAVDDLEAAVELYRVGKWSKACFFSHQAVEKCLKALLMKKLGVYRRTHSVKALLDEITSRINMPEDLVRAAAKLDRYYIPTRYPNAWPSLAPHKHYSREDAEEAVTTARRVLDYVRELLKEDP